MSPKKQNTAKKPSRAAKLPTKTVAASKDIPSFFDRQGQRPLYFFVSGILILMGFLVFSDYLLFHKIFMFKDIASDTLNTFYPNLVESARYLKKFGTLSWSFNIGMGQDGTAFAFNDPFNLILYLFPASKIAWLLGYKEFVKIVLTGFIFCLYLRNMGVSVFPSIAGALMVAFSGYMIIGGEWYVFSSEAFNTVLALLGFELLFRKNMPWLFPLPFFLLGITSPFALFLITLFLVFYTIFRYIQDERKGLKGLVFLFLKMAGLGIVGILISAPFLVDSIKVMLESARASGPDSYFATLSASPILGLADPLQLGTCVMRFFSSDMLGTADMYKGWNNYLEGPLFYCGIPCLLLVPLLFGYLSKKQKILFGALLAVWLLPVIFPYFRKAFWLFIGDYYRTYSLYVALIFIIFSVTCLDKLIKQKRLNVILLISIVIALILIQLLPYFAGKKVINESMAAAAKIFVIAYGAVLFWMSRQPNDLPRFAFLSLLVIELVWFSSISVKRNTAVKASEWTEKSGYNDYSNDAVAYIKSRENSFYRIEKFYGSTLAEHPSLNDGMVQDYYGTSSYYSFNQKYYLQYMRTFKIISAKNEIESRWCPGLTYRPILQCLNSVKYELAKEPMFQANDPLHDSVAKFGDVIVYKNKFALPLGFCYDKYMTYSNFEKLSLTQMDFTASQAAIINDADAGLVSGLKEIRLQDTLMPSSFTQGQLKDFFDSLKKETLDIKSFNPTHIKGNIELKSKKLLYLSIPNDTGWHIKVDGHPQPVILIGNGMTGVLLRPGKHEINLDYMPPYRKEGKWLAVVGLLVYGGGGLVVAGFKRIKRVSDKL